MQSYYVVVGLSCILLAVGLFFYRLWFVFTGNKLLGVVSKIVIKNSTLTGTTKSKHLRILYKNTEGVQCEFVADNSLLIYLYKVGESINLSEKNGQIIVRSILHIITAPVFLLIMGCATLFFVA